jgi:hypothetical protein
MFAMVFGAIGSFLLDQQIVKLWPFGARQIIVFSSRFDTLNQLLMQSDTRHRGLENPTF